jgi:hypothetical protein
VARIDSRSASRHAGHRTSELQPAGPGRPRAVALAFPSRPSHEGAAVHRHPQNWPGTVPPGVHLFRPRGRRHLQTPLDRCHDRELGRFGGFRGASRGSQRLSARASDSGTARALVGGREGQMLQGRYGRQSS